MALSSLRMVDDPSGTDEIRAERELDVLRLTDEVIGLSAEVAELRARLDVATERATAAAEVAQSAESAAVSAAERTAAFEQYLGEVTTGLGARTPSGGSSEEPALAALSRDELIGRVQELEAVLERRSVQVALGMTKKLRGS